MSVNYMRFRKSKIDAEVVHRTQQINKQKKPNIHAIWRGGINRPDSENAMGTTLMSKEPRRVVLIQYLTMEHLPSVRRDELQLEVVPVLEQQLRESVHGVDTPGEVGWWGGKELLKALKVAGGTLNDYDYTSMTGRLVDCFKGTKEQKVRLIDRMDGRTVGGSRGVVPSSRVRYVIRHRDDELRVMGMA